MCSFRPGVPRKLRQLHLRGELWDFGLTAAEREAETRRRNAFKRTTKRLCGLVRFMSPRVRTEVIPPGPHSESRQPVSAGSANHLYGP